MNNFYLNGIRSPDCSVSIVPDRFPSVVDPAGHVVIQAEEAEAARGPFPRGNFRLYALDVVAGL